MRATIWLGVLSYIVVNADTDWGFFIDAILAVFFLICLAQDMKELFGDK